MSTNAKKCEKNGQNHEAEAQESRATTWKVKKIKLRDWDAFVLQSKGLDQREIAEKLGCSQPTVCRGIQRAEEWRGATLPEERGELTAPQRFRVETERHRIFLEHAQQLALEDYHRSRASIGVKRTRTKIYPEGRMAKGPEVKEIQIDEHEKEQYGRISSLNAAVRYSQQLQALSAGYISAGNAKIAADEVIDPDEAERASRKAATEETKPSEPYTIKTGPFAGTCPYLFSREFYDKTESEFAAQSAKMNQEFPPAEVVTGDANGVCGEEPEVADAELRRAHKSSKMNQNPPAEGTIDKPPEKPSPPAPPPQPIYRWSDAQRQEALDLHCRLHKLPPAKLAQASGIPDPARMTPREFVERGHPYCISIDRSEEYHRIWKLNQHVFDEREAEMRRER